MKRKILSMTIIFTMIVLTLAGCSISKYIPQSDDLMTDKDITENIVIGEAYKNDMSDDFAEESIISDDYIESSNTVDIVPLSVLSDAEADNIKKKDLDSSWDLTKSTIIQLNGSTAAVRGDGVKVSGGTVTINQAGTYVISGSLSKGQIYINAPKEDHVRLVLNGVNITADKNAAIYAASTDKLLIILADGTKNIITDVSSYTYADNEKEEPDAAIFSKNDLTINGNGMLTVNAKFKNGIATKDDLIIVSGTFIINAPHNGLRGKDSVTIADGIFEITAGNDGIQTGSAEKKGWIDIQGGTFNIKAENDGIQAETDLVVSGGNFDIKTGGGSENAPVREEDFRGSKNQHSGFGFQQQTVSAEEDTESMKALKAKNIIYIAGGDFTIDAEDDAVHSNGNISVMKGRFNIKTGDDGFHADDALEIHGGEINIPACYEGLEGLSVTVAGGNISVIAKDDAVNAAGGSDSAAEAGGPMGRDNFKSFQSNENNFIRISGGTLDLYAPADALDSNGNIFIENGVIKISASSMGMDGAIDMDGKLTVTGGELITAGSVMNPSNESTQPVILISYTQQQTSGSVITIKDSKGNVILEYTGRIAFNMSGFTSKSFKISETYTLYINGVKRTDIKLNSLTTSINDTGGAYSGSQGGMGQPGGKGSR